MEIIRETHNGDKHNYYVIYNELAYVLKYNFVKTVEELNEIIKNMELEYNRTGD